MNIPELERVRLPLSRAEVHHAGKVNDRCAEAYSAAMAEALIGAGPFWPTHEWHTATDTPKFHIEQEVPIFCAVRRALAGIGLSDAERWSVVLTEVTRQASRYAETRAMEAA